MTEWGALYAEHVADLAAMAEGLDAREQALPVPATPAWRVRDVLAHLAGVADDNLTGREAGPGEDWSEFQVRTRADRSVSQLVAELEGHVAAVADLVDSAPRPALVWDVAVHHADLHEALDRGRLPEPLWRPVLDAVSPRAPALLEATSAYEAFRGYFSRRSREQMLAWGAPLTRDELDAACIFGPREDDQPVPG